MSHFHSNALLGASGNQGYEIQRSLRFNAGDGGFLHRTPSGAGNQKKYTISLWVKRTAFLASALDVSFLGAGDGTTYGISGTGAFGASLNGHVFMRNGGANVGYWDIEFRDPAAWTNFVLAIDTDQSTAANRNRLYVNGVDQGAPSANFGSGASTNINAASIHSIGTFNLPSSLSPFAGYFTKGYLQSTTLLMARSSAQEVLAKLILLLERGFLRSTSAPTVPTVFISTSRITQALLQQP